MNWGINEIGKCQKHYRAGQATKKIQKSQIEAVCKCGYITLKPQNDFEQHNGGLTVKRSHVRIVNHLGQLVKRLCGVQHWYACNACVNDWK